MSVPTERRSTMTTTTGGRPAQATGAVRRVPGALAAVAALLVGGMTAGGCLMSDQKSRDQGGDGSRPPRAQASTGSNPAPKTVGETGVKVGPTVDPGPSTKAESAVAGSSGGRIVYAEADDFTVAEVGRNVVRFSSVWMLVRDELRKQQKAMPTEQWEAFALARYRAELDEEISDLLLFDDAWKSLAPEAQTRVMAMADKRVKDSQNASGGEHAWRRQLRDRGLSVEQLKEIYARQSVIEYVLGDRFARQLVVRPDELTAEYEKNKSALRKPAAVRFRVLQLDAEGSKRAIDGNPDASPAQVRDFVSARLKEGADFVALTKRFGTYRAADGGWWREGQWTTEADLGEAAWKDALARLKPGEMTVEPVTSASGKGWVFLRLEERREESVAGLNDPLDGRPDMTVADALREKVKAQKLFKIFNDEQARLRGKSYIGRYDDIVLLAGIRRHASDWK